jgi:hypothetical protein
MWVLFVVINVGAWFCNTLRSLVLHAIEVSSYWSSRSLCRDCGCCPLACRRCLSCVGRVVIVLSIVSHVRLVA